MKNNHNFTESLVLAIIVSIAAALTYNYFWFIELPGINARMLLHQSILDGTAEPPYNYRLLVPLLTESSANIISFVSGIPFKISFALSYIIYNIFSLSLFLFTLYVYLKEWHSKSLSIIGTLFCAALLPISLRDHYFQPWSLIEAWFFVMTMYATYKARFSWVVIITGLAVLNRTTGIFIPLIYLLGSVDFKALINHPQNSNIKSIAYKFTLLVSISLVLILIVRNIQEGGAHIHSLTWIFEHNITRFNLAMALINLSLFSGAWWVFSIFGFKHADRYTKQLLVFVPLYLVPIIIFGLWKEVRMLLPIYPIIISLGLFYISKEGLIVDE